MGKFFILAMVIEFFRPVIDLWKFAKRKIRKRMNRLKAGSTCPVCDEGKLEKHVGTQIFRYHEKTLTVNDYITYDCPVCKEGFPDDAQWKTLVPKIKALQGRV